MNIMNDNIDVIATLYVYQPCCHDYIHRGASFGPKLPFSPNSGLRLDLIHVPSYGCPGDDIHALRNQNIKETDKLMNDFDPDSIKGMAVLVSRGECPFVSKIYNLQQLGAKAVIVYDNNPKSHDLITMGDEGKDDIKIEIPSIFVSYSTGMKLINELSPAKVDLFRADEEWVAPMMNVPLPLLAVFFLLMITVLLVSANSLLRACYRFRNSRVSGHHYVINNQGLLEPLGANVVIIDGSTKERSESEGEIYFVPSTLESSNNSESDTNTNTSAAIAITDSSSLSNETSESTSVENNNNNNQTQTQTQTHQDQ